MKLSDSNFKSGITTSQKDCTPYSSNSIESSRARAEENLSCSGRTTYNSVTSEISTVARCTMMDITHRFDGEPFDDYFVRLFEHKDEYQLDCQTIADLLNEECGEQFTESKFRKDFKVFNRGRIYERNHNEFGVCKRILAISDLHVPFQKPIETYKDFVGRIDILVINGDLCDCTSLSKFPKIYRSSPIEEMIEARQYLIDLIEYLQPKEVDLNYGNHDIRLQTYLAKNLDTDLLELMPQTALDLICNDGIRHYDKRQRTKVWYEPLCNVFTDIEIKYSGNWFNQVGKVIFCHPLAFKSGIMKTSYDAVVWFRNEGYDFTAMAMAHTHRMGEYPIGNTLMYEQGACCETKQMQYTDGKLTLSQREGFLYLCLDKDGNVLRDNSKLIYLN